MFTIVIVAGAVLALATLAALLAAIVAMKREDRMRTSVYHAPRTASTALTRRAFGLHVLGSPAYERR